MRRRLGWRPDRVAHEHHHQDGREQAEAAQEQQRPGRAASSEGRQGRRCQRDAERLSTLPDAHREAALVPREPAEDQPAACGEHRAAGRAAQRETAPQRGRAVDEGG